MQSRNSKNIKMIDVSHHQEDIDWLKVAGSGIQAAYVKATEGVGYIDPQFRRNAVGAPAAGMKVGFYHYCRPETGNNAKAEAESFVDAVNGLKSDLPHAIDVEGDARELGKEALTDWVYEWLSVVHEKTNHPVMIYVNDDFADHYCGSKLRTFPLWLAQPGVSTPSTNPVWSKWSIFQHDFQGVVSGIGGGVDLDEVDIDFWNQEVIGVEKKTKFLDVPAGAWFEEDIAEASKDGYMSGYPDGTFRPNDPLTRAEGAALYVRQKRLEQKMIDQLK